MASGAKMSFNPYQNGKFGNFPQTSPKDVEITQDLHLKMSKKIAQLTKVIYALNTKNDEHESVLQTLRDQHEEEIQQILADAKQKVAHCKDRLDEVSNHRATIENLQAKIAEYEVENSSIQNQFSVYKMEMKVRQEKEQEDYSARILQMSQEIMKAKEDFEENLKNFRFWKERTAAEHAVTIAELERKHQSELADLQGIQRNQDDTWLSQCATIEKSFKKEIEDLTSKIKILETDKVTLNEDYILKLEKATAFYEKELEALCHNQTQEYTNEAEQMKREIDRLKSDFSSSDKELRTQIDRLVHQLANTEDELKQSQKQLRVLEAELAGRDSNSSELSKQLHDLKKEMGVTISSLKNVEAELAGSKQHCSDLADELMSKSSKIGELEAYNNQKDGIIASQHDDIEKLTSQVRKLDIEKTSLATKLQLLTSEQSSTVQNLQQALDDLSVEKETLQERFQNQIKSFQQQLMKQGQEHTDELSLRMEEAKQKYVEALNMDRKDAANVLLSVKEELKQLHEAEINQIMGERNTLQQELKHLKTDLTFKLADSENKVARLEKLVKESEQGLGSASGQLASLKDTISQLRVELDQTRLELTTSLATAASLQADLDTLKLAHSDEVAQLKQSASEKLQRTTQELELRWAETMKSENCKLRQELTDQSESEKRAALSQLSRLKNEEIAATRADLEAKLECLKSQVEDLQSSLEDTKVESDVEKARLKYELEREKSRLSKNMLETTNEYSSKMATMEKRHVNEVEQLRAQMEQEKDNLETKLKKLHIEELQTQLTAHKASLDNTIKLEQREKQDALDKLKSKHQEETENLQMELEQKHKAEVDVLKQAHFSEIKVARMELERSVEISKQKDKDHLMQLEDLKVEIGYREQHIRNLQDQVKTLHEEISGLKSEIEIKVLEVKDVHKQSSQLLSLQEDKLTKQKQIAMDNLAADHLREQQSMLAQFSSAQELLKDKISALQIELEEACERYALRESRPEDLELIDTLRCEVSERETRIKDLIDEKRFYQLELVNRETNFNKVFNASPNVGILNPFQKPKKKGDKPSKLPTSANLVTGSGSSSIHQRLDPLPGSQLHDGKLNPSKPLPQPSFTKKLVK